ncbi:MAG TPA: bifunctional DNA-formamidopyrimidine glycosylase/DNA-(apurinic or apyrimidinic site) lyase [Thermomicrobiales bacterium]|nr:bifunctional DNA-formamidopyrimidine glycosylase/DNA-(apurinic or apyrimidinic site) lyase [Thermomicrobiales bacterium]
MPELPEVETVRTLIAPHVRDRRIVGVTVGAFTGVVESPLPANPVSLLTGATILDVQRRGKYLIFQLDTGLWMTVHLRMTGRLIVCRTGDPAIRFEHIAFHLDSGEDIRFGDQRKFGRVTLLDEDHVASLESRLGPEPFDPDLTGPVLHPRLARRTGSIKGALLDQRLIAGLGNIYVDEALWRAKIHPLQTANRIDEETLARLLDAIRSVLGSAIEHQGTTFSSFENPYGEAGGNARFLKVYGRSKTDGTCDRCGGQLQRMVVAGRGTTLCPTCQRIDPSQIPGDDFDSANDVGPGLQMQGGKRR